MMLIMMMLMMVRKATVMILITTVHVIISTTPSSPACTWIATTTSTSTMEHMPLETSGWAGHQFGWSEKNKSSVRQSRWRRKFFGVMSISSQLQKRNKTRNILSSKPNAAGHLFNWVSHIWKLCSQNNQQTCLTQKCEEFGRFTKTSGDPEMVNVSNLGPFNFA